MAVARTSMAGRIVAAVVVAVLAVGLFVALRGGGDSSGAIVTYSASERQPMPAFSGTTLDGDKLDLAQYRGKVVVLNVWGSWCSPCRQEANALQRVFTETQAKGVQFVGVNVREPSAATAKAYVDEFGITYPSIAATDDVAPQLALRKVLTVSPPATMVIDGQGRIAAAARQKLTQSELLDLLQPVLDEAS